MISSLKSLIRRSPKLYFSLYYIKYYFEIARSKRLIILTTPGHVGSSSVFNSIVKTNWESGTKIYNIHSLTERYNSHSEVPSISARHVLQQVLCGALENSRLRNKEIIVITLIRDPVGRALSGLFQAPDAFLRQFDLSVNNKDDYHKFLVQFSNDSGIRSHVNETISWQLDFYNKELQDYWNIDVSKAEIPFDGLLVFKSGKMTFFGIVLEELDTVLPKLMQRYFQKQIEIVRKNSNEQHRRSNSSLYDYVKKNFEIEEQLLLKTYTNTVIRKAYSSRQIDEFRTNWSSKARS